MGLPACGRQAPPGLCCLPVRWRRVPGSAWAWEGVSPCRAEGPSLPGPGRSPPHLLGGPAWTHLVGLPHPSIVCDVFPEGTEAIHLQAGDRMAGVPGLPSSALPQARAVVCPGGGRSRSGRRPGPRSSCHTGRPCTPTACGSAGPRSYSTSPSCSHSCRSSGLDGGGGLPTRPGLRSASLSPTSSREPQCLELM